MKCQHEPSSNIHHNQVKVSHEGESDSLSTHSSYSAPLSMVVFILDPTKTKPHTFSLIHFLQSPSFLPIFFFLSIFSHWWFQWVSWKRAKSQLYYISIFWWKKRKGSLSLSNLISNSVSFLTHHLSLILSSLFPFSFTISPSLPLPLFIIFQVMTSVPFQYNASSSMMRKRGGWWWGWNERSTIFDTLYQTESL